MKGENKHLVSYLENHSILQSKLLIFLVSPKNNPQICFFFLPSIINFNVNQLFSLSILAIVQFPSNLSTYFCRVSVDFFHPSIMHFYHPVISLSSCIFIPFLSFLLFYLFAFVIRFYSLLSRPLSLSLTIA